jgi:predicted nucleotidyltransferase
MYYEDVFRRLNEKKVRYIVIGGVALVLHGVVRLTVDLDLMLDLDKNNLEKFVSVVKSLGYKPKMPVKTKDFFDPNMRNKWRKEKNMKVFSFYNPKKPINLIDVFFDEPIDFNKIYKSRKVIKVDNFKLPIISIEHLIKLKKLSGRAQDIADIKSLKKLISIKNEKKKRK